MLLRLLSCDLVLLDAVMATLLSEQHGTNLNETWRRPGKVLKRIYCCNGTNPRTDSVPSFHTRLYFKHQEARTGNRNICFIPYDSAILFGTMRLEKTNADDKAEYCRLQPTMESSVSLWLLSILALYLFCTRTPCGICPPSQTP